MAIDLTGGETKVIGNCGDVHLFRISNPEDQDIISSESSYEAEFFPSNKSSSSSVDLNLSEIEIGALIFSVTISPGIYVIRRLVPRRTILTMEVESR